MNSYHKFASSFVLALSLHFVILALFGISFMGDSETETLVQKPLPEIIQASMLDDEKIILEAERLKVNEQNKQVAVQQKQRKIDHELKKQQQQLAATKKRRLQEEKKTKALEKKGKELALKEKKERQQINKLRAEESARLAKIKVQKQAEKVRLKKQRQAEEKRRTAEKLAKETKQYALLAKQKVDQAKKQAWAKQQAVAAKGKLARDNQATISSTVAIQAKVNNSWIRPISSAKGLRCTIRVKLLPSGDVMDSTIIKSSGDRVFDRSAENAVLKATPLPVPKDRALFAKKFRTFTFVFKPE